MSEITLPVGARTLAIAQARAFAKHTLLLGAAVASPPEPGELLAYLVNAGLSIELYFKAFMIAGRGGRVTTGHDLKKLLQEFPPELREAFNLAYAAHPTAATASFKMVALVVSASPPSEPTQRTFRESYVSFDAAVESLAHVFIKARYLFECVSGPEWAVFSCPTDAIAGVLNSLEVVYQGYASGAFEREA